MLIILTLFSVITLSAQNDRTVTIPIPSFSKLCPNSQYGHLTNGDHEFGGSTRSKFDINLQANGNKIYATVNLDMQENNNRSDRTIVKAFWRKVVYTAPYGNIVKGFKIGSFPYGKNTTDKVTHIGRAGGAEFGFCNDAPSSFANIPVMGVNIEYKGDTGSNDVSSDQDCNCDSRIEKITFNRVMYVKIGGEDLIHNREYYMLSAIGGKAASVKNRGTANGTPVEMWQNVYQDNQKFTLENAGGGYFYIKASNGKYIHVQNNLATPRALALIWAGKGGDNTKWKFIPAGNGYYYIQSKKGTYLDVQWGSNNNNTPIWMWPFNGGNAQKWIMKSTFSGIY